MQLLVGVLRRPAEALKEIRATITNPHGNHRPKNPDGGGHILRLKVGQEIRTHIVLGGVVEASLAGIVDSPAGPG